MVKSFIAAVVCVKKKKKSQCKDISTFVNYFVFMFYNSFKNTAYVPLQSLHIFQITATARLRKDIHVLNTAEEMKEHKGTSCDLLSCADVIIKRGIIQSRAFLMTLGHRCAAQPL